MGKYLVTTLSNNKTQEILYDALYDDVIMIGVSLKEFFEKTRFLPVTEQAKEPFKAVCKEYLTTKAFIFSKTIYRDYGDLFSTEEIAENFMDDEGKMDALKQYIHTYWTGDSA